MNSKSLVWIFMAIGSALGGAVPLLWGSDYLSFSSIIFTAVGGIFGIWLAFKMTH